jgi:hypothetical protein
MKSSYELAMERLGGDDGTKLSDDQKAQIAEIDNRGKAKVAQLEVMQQQQVEAAAGDAARLQALLEAFATDVAKTREKTEREKEKVRNAG